MNCGLNFAMTSLVFLLIALISLYALASSNAAELVEDLHDLVLDRP
jgi:hypothetical protein